MLAALHDMDLVRAHFPRDAAAGARRGGLGRRPREVLTADNLREARRMCEAFDDSAAACAGDADHPRAA